jgi:small subunit ribosomal protein S6
LREYELVYVLHPDLSPEREAEIHQRLDDIVAKGGGQHLLRDDWGKRKLAYEIQKLQKGHYFLLSFLSAGSFNADLERELRLNADVIRFLTVCVDEKVSDPQDRAEKAKVKAAEQARRREQREREAAERRAADERRGERPDEDDDDDGEED